MVTAAAQDQWRLLDVQAHDTRLGQLAHRERTLPEHLRVAELAERLRQVGDELVAARTAASDVARELTKAEADVEQVRSRARRNQQRLDSGQGNAKDLSSMQHEIETLAARQAVLEDVELEVMERQEAAEAAVEAVDTEQERLSTELKTVQAALDEQLAVLHAEVGTVEAARANAAGGVPQALLALYEKVRANSGGVGAARLYQRRCEGCRIELPPQDLARIRNAAEDEVLRCEECSRILVRTPDSGPLTSAPLRPPDLAPPTTLLLVRHGRTAATGVRLSGGDTPGPPLTPEGEAEARALAPLLPPVDAVVASPTVRTLATAALLGAGPATEDDGFVETRLGDWDGSTTAELAAREPEAFRAWMLSPSLAPPGGESIEQLAARVGAARDRVVRDHPGRTVLVVTHTGPVRALVAAALDAGPAAFWRLRVRPAGLTVLRVWADGGVEVAAVNAGPPEMIAG